ncbi:hypothetical protein PFISCL1PPCAC_18993, partial [Pristionchus fissidentatus]
LLMEIATLIAFTRLERVNERRLEQDNKFNLSERYQIEENLRMVQLLLPVVWTHTAITIVGLIAFFVYTILQLAPVYDPIYEDSIQFIHLQCIFMPTCFYVQYRRSLHRNEEMMSTNRGSGEAYIVKYYDCIQ